MNDPLAPAPNARPQARPRQGLARWRVLWRHWWRQRMGLQDPARSRAPAWVPIRGLRPRHRPRILAHLLALDAQDRYLRFGYPATDEQIGRYVAELHFERDELFGIFNRRLQLVAMAHLAYAVEPDLSTCAEFGVSVSAHQRGRGLGARLFDHAVVHARNNGVRQLFIHALSENAPMLRIARKAGATVQREGGESEAWLRLPEATLDSQLSGLWQDQAAELDYRLKQQAQGFLRVLAALQEIRQGVREAKRTT